MLRRLFWFSGENRASLVKLLSHKCVAIREWIEA